MKKFSICYLLLFLMHGLYGMDIVSQIEEEEYQRIGRLGRYMAMKNITVGFEECPECNNYFVVKRENPRVKPAMEHKEITQKAIDFIARIPDIKFCDLASECSKLDENVAQEVDLLSRQNVLVSYTLNKDLFANMWRCLPDFYEDHGGFFRSKNYKGGQIEYTMDGLPKKDPNLLISKEKMMHKLWKKPVEEVLSVFYYVTQKSIETKRRFDNREITSCFDKVPGHIHVRPKLFFLKFKDAKNMTKVHHQLFRDIIEKSNEAIDERDINLRYKITNEHIPLLQEHKQSALNNHALREAQIITDLIPPTTFEAFKDECLFFLPRFLVIASPDVMHRQISGILGGTAGLLLCSLGCSCFGDCFYPLIDSNNSRVHELSKWFGVRNHTRIKRGIEFGWTGGLQYVFTALAQRLCSWGTIPWKIVGGTIHGIRVLVSLFVMYNIHEYYKNPFKRTNKNGRQYMFEDLLRGPKFTEKE